jgi:regulator of nucleoside diphosphate kinase
MIRRTAPKRPPINLINTEADTPADLAIGAQDRLPQINELLLEELTRAKVHNAERIPKDVITMKAQVEFVDDASYATRIAQLVYPRHAD